MEQLLSDARQLVQRLHHHDTAADALISDATNLETKLLAMKEYREEVTKLNEISKHRPRSTLILGSQLENQRIQDLENENRELHYSLSEHQSALELIMNKYREQVLNLLTHKGLDKNALEQLNRNSCDVNVLTEKIMEMAAVMQKAVKVDEKLDNNEVETIAELKFENKVLRELLHISGHPKKEIERLKMKEFLEQESVIVKDDKPMNKNLEHDSSIEDLEHDTGTVRRRVKLVVDDIDKSSILDKEDNMSEKEELPLNHQKDIQPDALDGCREEQQISEEKIIENHSTMQADITTENLKGLQHSASTLDSSEEMESNVNNDIEQLNLLEEYPLKDYKDNNELLHIQASIPLDSDAASGKPEVASNIPVADDNSVKMGLVESDHADVVSANEAEDMGGNEDALDPLKMYNSEGRLLENVEEAYSLQGRPGKLSGIKIRKSNKQKKIIEAGLKSFFANEANQSPPNEAREKKDTVDSGEKLEESPSSDGNLTSNYNEDSGMEILSKDSHDSGDFSTSIASSCRDVLIEKTENIPSNEEIIENKGNEDPLIVDSKSSSSDSTDGIGQPRHKTIELDFSDSDSEDLDEMIEDQFAGIIDEDSDSDSSSNGTDEENEELEPTEMELIGDLNEGGEIVVSQWERPEEDYSHLGETWKKQDQEKNEDDSLEPNERELDEGNQSNVAQMAEQTDFSFTEAALQLDQFTGGSIKAKFAKRKSYKNADRASAVTLSADMLTKDISSENNLAEDIVTEGTSSSTECMDLTDPQKTLNIPVLTKNSGEMLSTSSSDSSSHTSDEDLLSNKKMQLTADATDSASGEIDQLAFESNVSADAPRERRQSDCAQHLTELLSDLDAVLAISDDDDDDDSKE